MDARTLIELAQAKARLAASKAEDAATEMEILRRELAQARDLGERAAEYSKALSAEIERLRGENRLILDALGMEKYRVRWRPVSDEGFKNAMGEEMLIVYDGPVWVTRLIMISRWSPVAGWNLRNGNPVAEGTVTHWAPLPGLPEEVGE